METSLTVENIHAIIQAMNKIKHLDRSEYFNNYYAECHYRIYCEEQAFSRKECMPFESFKKNLM